jgi:5'-nucleotidase
MQERTILCTDKSLLKGDYLIDDQTNHGQKDFEGELIHFATKEFPNWNSVLNFFGKKIDFESLYGC